MMSPSAATDVAGSSAASIGGFSIGSGSSELRVCRWCDRKDTDVCWARKQGRECGPCRSFIKSEGLDLDKGELEREVATPLGKKNYVSKLLAWESRRKGGRRKPRAAPHRKSVKVGKFAQVQSSMVFSHFWPTPIWEAFFKQKAPKEDITKCRHNGMIYRGIHEDPMKGWQSGVIKLKSKSINYVDKNATALSTDDETEEARTKFTRLQKQTDYGAGASRKRWEVVGEGSETEAQEEAEREARLS